MILMKKNAFVKNTQKGIAIRAFGRYNSHGKSKLCDTYNNPMK